MCEQRVVTLIGNMVLAIVKLRVGDYIVVENDDYNVYGEDRKGYLRERPRRALPESLRSNTPNSLRGADMFRHLRCHDIDGSEIFKAGSYLLSLGRSGASTLLLALLVLET